jgi:tetratricopeptide (TPR) repeat protein
MEAIIPLTQGLYNLGADLLKRHRFSEGVRILRRLLDTPDLSPTLAADANQLLANVHYEHRDFAQMRRAAERAVEKNPANAEAHFLLAEAASHDEMHPEPAVALDHYAKAAELAPEDAAKQTAYGMQLVRSKNADAGIAVMERTYVRHGRDPMIVSEFAQALIEADRTEDAELMVAQACDRNRDDRRFSRVRQSVQQRVWHRRVSEPSGGGRENRSEPRSVIPFRSFGGPESPRPRGNRRILGFTSKPTPKPKAPTAGPPVLTAKMTLAEVIKRMGRNTAYSIGETLGLFGKEAPKDLRREITAAFDDSGFVRRHVQSLPAETRRLLRTVVRAGGFLPASVLFQNTGPDAPPPDYVQPLVERGMLFFGREKASSPKLVAMIPSDLIAALAKALRVRPGR